MKDFLIPAAVAALIDAVRGRRAEGGRRSFRYLVTLLCYPGAHEAAVQIPRPPPFGATRLFRSRRAPMAQHLQHLRDNDDSACAR